jgi:hypothetical protein
MQLKKEINNSCEFSQQTYPKIAISMVLLLSVFISNGAFNVFAQQQQQPNAGSLVNSICQLVRDNGLISGLVGLDQALNICNNLNSIGSNQALTQLCSTIGGLNVINIDTFCNQQQAANQSLPLNENSQTPNSQDAGIENSQGNTESPPSSSIIDRILGLLFGFFNF